MKIFAVNKQIGQTPLEALEKLRKKLKISPQTPLTYAGRLDPLAEGLLLILQKSSQKQKERFLKLPKTYVAEILLGFATDTGDLLGMAIPGQITTPGRTEILKTLKSYRGQTILPLPAFASVPFKGKPLFELARAGFFKNRPTPKRTMYFFQLKLISQRGISSKNLLQLIQKKVGKVSGDFRQKQILSRWKKLLAKNRKKWPVLKLKISCSSGTYIRSLAADFGTKLKTNSALLSLKRTHIGKYSL